MTEIATPALLSAWLEQSNDLLVLTDLSGSVHWTNPRFLATTGLGAGPTSSLLGLAPEGAAAGSSRDTLTKALATGTLADTELQLRSLSGAKLLLQGRSAVVQEQMLWTFQDTTPRRLETQAQRRSLHDALDALQQASERVALITSHAGIGTWEADLNGEPERWDVQMFHLRGLPVAPSAPSRAARMALVHPDDQHLVLESRESPEVASQPGAYEFRVRLPDGSYRWLASRSAVVRNERGAAIRRVGVNWDITESRNAELTRQRAALAKREVQAKSQFLSRMSHELRTPLNAVLGFTQLLQIEASQAAAKSQIAKLGHIRSAGEHLLGLINDVLDLSSLESGELKLQLQPVYLGLLVAQALPPVEALAAQQAVTIRTDAVGGVAFVDPIRMRQVLISLFSNAIKYNGAAARSWSRPAAKPAASCSPFATPDGV